MSSDAILDLTAAVVVFGSFLGVLYIRELWTMARGSRNIQEDSADVPPPAASDWIGSAVDDPMWSARDQNLPAPESRVTVPDR